MKIEVKDLCFSYGAQEILSNIDLTIDRPGLVCIVGPNGVGKSTLVKCIMGLNKYSTGTITLDDIDLQSISKKDRAKVLGYVPVESSESFSMNVFDSVMQGRHPHQNMRRTTGLDKTIAIRSLNMMGMLGFAMKNTNELSAGQRQKVNIAKGLTQTPRILFLDEPTANLDPRHQLQVTERISTIARHIGMTVVMVSHDLNTSAKYADEIVMMALPGIIYKVGTPREVLTEETINNVYGVQCNVIDDDGRPHVILKRALEDEEMIPIQSNLCAN